MEKVKINPLKSLQIDFTIPEGLKYKVWASPKIQGSVIKVTRNNKRYLGGLNCTCTIKCHRYQNRHFQTSPRMSLKSHLIGYDWLIKQLLRMWHTSSLTYEITCIQNRDQPCFSMHKHLLDPEGSVETRAWKARVLTTPEGSSRC